MKDLFTVTWINPTNGFSGSMHNVRKAHVEETIDRAWVLAGDDGEVSFGQEKGDQVEYAF